MPRQFLPVASRAPYIQGFVLTDHAGCCVFPSRTLEQSVIRHVNRALDRGCVHDSCHADRVAQWNVAGEFMLDRDLKCLLRSTMIQQENDCWWHVGGHAEILWGSMQMGQ